MKSWAVVFMIVPLVLFSNARPGEAFDADRVFTKGGYVLSLEGGYGEQFDAWSTTITGLDAFNAGVRFGLLPWGATGSGPLKGALEIGVEPFYQRFIDPVDAFFAGLGVVARYHILPLGRFVPYIELSVAPGATDLRVREQDTDFCFSSSAGSALHTSSRIVQHSMRGTGSSTSRTRTLTVRIAGSIRTPGS
jgi:hypothetical protein